MATNPLISPRSTQCAGDAAIPDGAGTMADELSLFDLLIVLARRKNLILSITMGIAIAVTVAGFLVPKSYTATVLLLPPQQNFSLSSQLASQLGNLASVAQMAGGGSLLKNPNDMYVAMLKSRTVEDAMVRRFGLMQEYRTKYLSDARRTFEKRVKVDGSSKDGLIHISVEDCDPRRAAALANGYVDQFHELSKNLAFTEAQQRRQFFEEQWKQANKNLTNAEEALKETEQKTGLIQLDSQARALIESAASLRAQIAVTEVRIQGMQTYATGENAQLVEAQQELAGLRAQLAKLGGNGDSSGGLIVPKGQLTADGMEYVRRLRDVKYYEAIFDILARQFELAKLDEAKEGTIIQVVDPAIPPDKKSFPRHGVFLVCGLLLGLIAGICCALGSACLANLQREEESRARLLQLKQLLSFEFPQRREKPDYVSAQSV